MYSNLIHPLKISPSHSSPVLRMRNNGFSSFRNQNMIFQCFRSPVPNSQMALILPLTDIARVPRCPRACIAGRVKDQEPRILKVSDPLRAMDASPVFPAPLLRVYSPPSPSPSASLEEQQQRDGGEDQRDYYVNMGYAIRTLREELPEVFYREPNFDIYRDDIVFKDPLNTFSGIENYRMIFWALRFSGNVFFESLWVDIVSIWQPIENIVMIRWIVHGIPRVPWESRGRFDGTSEYKFDKNGKIFEHKVDNIAINSPPRFRVLALEEMIQSLGCPSTPKPTFFKVFFSRTSDMPALLRFTWIRLYLALYAAFAWRSVGKG